jgi:hypothetical protein
MAPSNISNKSQKVNAVKDSKLPAGADMDHQKKKKDKKECKKEKKAQGAREREAESE